MAEITGTGDVEEGAQQQARQDDPVQGAHVLPEAGPGGRGPGPAAVQDEAGQDAVDDEEDGVGLVAQAGQEIEAGQQDVLVGDGVVVHQQQEPQVVDHRHEGAGPAGELEEGKETVAHEWPRGWAPAP